MTTWRQFWSLFYRETTPDGLMLPVAQKRQQYSQWDSAPDQHTGMQEPTIAQVLACKAFCISIISKYLKRKCQEDRARLLSVWSSDRKRGSGHKLEHGMFLWMQGKPSLLWGWRSTRTGCPERVWSLLLWKYLKPVWMLTCVTMLGTCFCRALD